MVLTWRMCVPWCDSKISMATAVIVRLRPGAANTETKTRFQSFQLVSEILDCWVNPKTFCWERKLFKFFLSSWWVGGRVNFTLTASRIHCEPNLTASLPWRRNECSDHHEDATSARERCVSSVKRNHETNITNPWTSCLATHAVPPSFRREPGPRTCTPRSGPGSEGGSARDERRRDEINQTRPPRVGSIRNLTRLTDCAITIHFEFPSLEVDLVKGGGSRWWIQGPRNLGAKVKQNIV